MIKKMKGGCLVGQKAFATGISTLNERSFSVFPSPSKNYAIIRRENSNKERLKIINSMGQVVYEKELVSNVETIYLDSISPGLYIVKIKNHQEKLMINR